MSVKKDASGRRHVQDEVEAPGTPEEVWRAIATGPGISAWFVPTRSEEREGGEIVCTFGPGMDCPATITTWEAGKRFVAEAAMGPPGSPTVATEWTVEARAGGTCIVRVVHSLFASTDDWDNQLESAAHGWPGFFRILRIYLTHFRGRRSALMQFMAPVAGSEAEAWDALTAALKLNGVNAGRRWTSPAGAPALGGVAEFVSRDPNDLLVRLDKPAPGVAAFGTFNYGGPSMVALNFYFYGDHADETVARETPSWQAWIQERFPMPTETNRSE